MCVYMCRCVCGCGSMGGIPCEGLDVETGETKLRLSKCTSQRLHKVKEIAELYYSLWFVSLEYM